MKILSTEQYIKILKVTYDIESTEKMITIFLGTNYQFLFVHELIQRLKKEIQEKSAYACN